MNINPDLFQKFYDHNLIENWPSPELLPRLDRPNQEPTTNLQAEWQDDGLVILPNFMPEYFLDRYAEAWLRDNANRPRGWPFDVPYMYISALMDMLAYEPLHKVMEELIEEPMGTHLNLTGWRSTQRNWHQDGYLNPDHVHDFYCAVWIALDDIHPDAGPFQFIRGSHTFPVITNQKMLAALKPEQRGDNWPKHSEEILTPIFEQLLIDAELNVESFIAQKGDVLIWHSRLMHRGSAPINPDLERRACIAHYSGIDHRPDMPNQPLSRIGRTNNFQLSGYYFPIEQAYR
jgi:hypothetical protein